MSSWVICVLSGVARLLQELQRGSAGRQRSSDRVPVSLPQLAEALCGDASAASVLAALRALVSDRTYFKQARLRGAIRDHTRRELRVGLRCRYAGLPLPQECAAARGFCKQLFLGQLGCGWGWSCGDHQLVW